MPADFLAYPEKVQDLAIASTLVAVLRKAQGRLTREYSIDFKLNNDGFILFYHAWNELLRRSDPESDTAMTDVVQALTELKHICRTLCFLLCAVQIVSETDPLGYVRSSMFESISSLSSEFFSLHVAYQCYRHFAFKITKEWPSNWFSSHDFADLVGLCRVLRDNLYDVEQIFDQLIPLPLGHPASSGSNPS